ncbi:MAG: hypothetical protein RLZZ602_1371, partial [Pseudomonadota bacterium]
QASYKGDGRIRLSEVGAMMLYPGVIPGTNISTGIPGGPFNLFDLKLTANISPYVYAAVGLETFALKLFTLNLPSLNLNAPIVTPILGSLSNGTLSLNAGVGAADRKFLNTEDSAETFVLSGLDAGVVDVEFDGFVTRYTGVNKVVADLGNGNDLLDASRLLNNVLLDVKGGDGDDTILLGAGGGTVVDLSGSNTIRALENSIRPVTFITGSGDDELYGGAGNDILFAGAGDNRVFGGAGADSLYGVLGVNRLVGNEGQDKYIFVGQLGANTLIETGTEASELDFSGEIPAAFKGFMGVPEGAPAVSIPAVFNAVRGDRQGANNQVEEVRSALIFVGAPFSGDNNNPMTVTLSTVDGKFDASSADGVVVESSGTATTTFTGSIANLNRYFTTSGRVHYVFTAADDSRLLNVTAKQAGVSSQAQATISRADRYLSGTLTGMNWTDLAVSGNVMAATISATEQHAGLYLSGDGGKTWKPVNAFIGRGFDAVSISPDGRQIAAISSSGNLAISRDSGLTWSETKAPDDLYDDIAVLNDGSILAVDRPTSERYSYKVRRGIWPIFWEETEWANRDTPGTLRMRSVAGSWTNVEMPNGKSSLHWKDISVSADGSRILAVAGRSVHGSAEGALYMGSVTGTGKPTAKPSTSNSPPGETAEFAVDGNAGTKYLNADGAGSGLMITLPQSQVIRSIGFTTANDASERDPMQFTLYGANSDLAWGSSGWTPIVGPSATNLSQSRGATSTVSFANNVSFSHYKIVFNALRGNTNLVQIADVNLGSRAWTDRVVTWTDITRGALSNGDWNSLDMDDAGRRMVATTSDGRVFVADTSVANWTWRGVDMRFGDEPQAAISSDGSALVVSSRGNGGGVFVSTDFGQSWTRAAGRGEMGVAGNEPWTEPSIDTASGRVVAAVRGGGMLNFAIPPSASTNLVLPEQLSVYGDKATALVFPMGSLYDADSRQVSLTIEVERGGFAVASQDARAAGLQVSATATGLTLS